ncbi:alpha/beta-hydrolase [Polychaeton citri CBS 116435]|uniref:Alpha/beta-hydrolase n=1 Tax=Polychaeton citri CBS 116435 TaxID=1314669 RepID=A0A9P4QI07_9PEZI|nr:alpha/beta-hydrolase [Polychaeton citri CBS 116435]
MGKRLPEQKDFPSSIKLSIVPPPNSKPATNILLLLHGLGDTNASFTQLGKNLNLPETACVSIQAPKTLLDLGGFHWGDDIIFDGSAAGLDADGGFKESNALLRAVVEDVLVAKCEYVAREVLMFGFGQGGMAALSSAASLHDTSSAELGGVISIGAGLPSEAPAALIAKCKTPVLICAGSDNSAVALGTEDKLSRVFEHVEVRRYRKPGDSMPSNRDEMMPIMQFLSRRLKSTAGVPEGSVEIG